MIECYEPNVLADIRNREHWSYDVYRITVCVRLPHMEMS